MEHNEFILSIHRLTSYQVPTCKRRKLIEKSLSSETTTARTQKKQQKEASRHAAPDARELDPTCAGSRAVRFYNFCRCIPNDATRTRSNGFSVSPFSELFLDRSDSRARPGGCSTRPAGTLTSRAWQLS